MSVPEVNKYLTPNAVLEAAANHAGNKILNRSIYVMDVEVFGSIARGKAGENSDINLILTVGEPTARSFFDFIRFDKDLGADADADKHIRCRWAYELLGCPNPREYVLRYFTQLPEWEDLFDMLYGSHRMYDRIGDMLDVLLLPVNWRSRLNEFQELGQFSDPEFMQHIARDARLIELD